MDHKDCQGSQVTQVFQGNQVTQEFQVTQVVAYQDIVGIVVSLAIVDGLVNRDIQASQDLVAIVA